MKKYGAFPAVLVMAVLFSCTTPKAATGDKESPAPVAGLADDDPRKRQSVEKFIEASKMEMLGDYQQALNLYRECLKVDPANDAAYFQIARILYGQKQYTDALQYVQQASRIDPTNTWYLDLEGTLYGGLGDYRQAIRVYQQMTKLEPENPDAWYNLAFFTEQNKQYAEAITLFDQIERQFGISEEISMEKQKLWMQLGKKEKAAAEIQRLIDANPGEPKYYSLLVDFYMTNGMEDEAYEALQKLMALDAADPKAYLVMASYYQRKGDAVKAHEAFQKAFSNPSLDVDIGITVLLTYLEDFQKPTTSNEVRRTQAIDLARLLVQSHPSEAKAAAMYADLLYQNDDYEEALVQYQKSIDLDNSKFVVWQQLFFLYDKQRNFDSLQAVTARAVELFPDQSMAYYFNGYSLMQQKKFREALAPLGKAIEMGSPDKRFLSQLYASLGDAYNNLEDQVASDSCYEMALVFDPSNAYVLNNYAYFLSLRGDKLDEALKMAERANILAPNTAAYEDTYGWVLYKAGRLADAREWIGKALQHGGDQDGTVLEHYGDVLFKMGENDQAVQFWIMAKDKNVDSEMINKKISERKLYE